VVGVVATLPTILCIPWMLRSSWAPLVELRRDLLEDIAPDLVRGPWPLLVFISVSAGIGEEALFRGALQVWSAGWIGLIPAIVGSALVFGLMHPFSWVYIGMAAVVGAWWGVVMVASGQLAAAMIAHALHDIVAMFALRWRLDEHLAPRWARSWLGLPPRGAARRS
jgi:membrane protease YdiL (CAAX protease family)